MEYIETEVIMMANNTKIRKAIKEFIEKYKCIEKSEGKISEDSYRLNFWLQLLQSAFNFNGIDYLDSEKKVKDSNNNTKKIDIYIPKTRVLIEHKSSDVDLNKHQPGHNNLTPFEQAREYQTYLPTSEKAKWIIVCNFKEFHIYDMDSKQPLETKAVIKLENLPERYNELKFIVDNTVERIVQEQEISITAGKIIGDIYNLLLDEFTKKGITPSEKDLNEINIVCVRLVFCLYAEDSGMFNEHQQFGKFLVKYKDDPNIFRKQLKELFTVLNTKTTDRDQWLEKELNDFPYINGGLFAQKANIPNISKELIDYLINKASFETDWSLISPTIFGSIFESTLNLETRRKGGMHYTSIENIHKVIDPLFLDDLKIELNEILEYKQENVRNTKLREFQDKIASLTFLDPACGSGNFLTETYLSLRDLEDKLLLKLYGANDSDQFQPKLANTEDAQVKVSINQFYGIEINDFAVDVAKTALWIAEYQCLQKTLDKGINTNVQTLPLKSNNNIIVANALKVDWNDLIHNSQLNYIMGNPPFIGARNMKKGSSQKKDVEEVWKGTKNLGNLDYVTCWYKIASEYMKETKIQASLVSTNSICQGEQAGLLWKSMFDKGLVINNAYRTFIWDNESPSKKAHVYCVIVQFSYVSNAVKKLFAEKTSIPSEVSYINQYLLPFKVSIVENRENPLSDIPTIGTGNQPIDGGYYLFLEDEMKEFIKKEPKSAKYFKKWYGADEFLNGYCRYCLWLGDCSPNEIRSMPLCLDRVEKVREFRLSSPREQTKKYADKPTRFYIENMPKGDFILLPENTTSVRNYIPMGFMNPHGVLVSNLAKIIPNVSLFHFGILQSVLHMAWMRVVCGRLGNGYRYSIGIVYNNFVWVKPNDKQKEKIEKAAQSILDARNNYPDSSLADLYDSLAIPSELRKAHENNDKAVLELYGLSKNSTEEQMVELLFKLYDAKIAGAKIAENNDTKLELL